MKRASKKAQEKPKSVRVKEPGGEWPDEVEWEDGSAADMAIDDTDEETLEEEGSSQEELELVPYVMVGSGKTGKLIVRPDEFDVKYVHHLLALLKESGFVKSRAKKVNGYFIEDVRRARLQKVEALFTERGYKMSPIETTENQQQEEGDAEPEQPSDTASIKPTNQKAYLELVSTFQTYVTGLAVRYNEQDAKTAVQYFLKHAPLILTTP